MIRTGILIKKYIMDDTGLSSDFFVGNRKKLQELFSGTAPIVIAANSVMQRSGDTTWPFVQESNFYYLTGITRPGVLLVMDKGKEYLILPEQSVSQSAFEGVFDPLDLQQVSGIEVVLDEKKGWKQLEARIKKVKHVATLAAPLPYVKELAMFTIPARNMLIKKLKDLNPDLALLDLRPHLTHQRSIKQPLELQALECAIAITCHALRYIARPGRLATYRYEYEIEADLTWQFIKAGANGHSFPPVVASGNNACIIHHMDNRGLLDKRDLVIIDTGADVHHYAADIARTYSLSNNPSARQKAVYQAVKDSQDHAIGLLKPGLILKDYEKIMEQFIGEKLRELGVIKNVTSEEVRKYFPHRVTHYLGLDVHDTGDYEQPLEPGMVVTCEPGIYIPEAGMGIRLEDDILITKKGCKILSHNLPSTLV